jgi:hypothetical protein
LNLVSAHSILKEILKPKVASATALSICEVYAVPPDGTPIGKSSSGLGAARFWIAASLAPPLLLTIYKNPQPLLHPPSTTSFL